jgi:hypothetical protein
MITRTTVIKEILKRLDPTDITVFIGAALCEEAYVNDCDTCFYIPNDYSIGLTFVLGLALSTEKRVFVFSSDSLFLYDASAALQMAVSECKNLCYILLNSGMYLGAGGHPNIFPTLSHPQGVFFRMGFTSFVFDSFFNIPGGLKEIKGMLDTIIGPTAIFVEVGKRRGNIKELDKPMSFFSERLKNNLNTEGTALFEPPNINELEFVK